MKLSTLEGSYRGDKREAQDGNRAPLLYKNRAEYHLFATVACVVATLGVLHLTFHAPVCTDSAHALFAAVWTVVLWIGPYTPPIQHEHELHALYRPAAGGVSVWIRIGM